MDSLNEQRLYLQGRKNPLLKVFGKGSMLRQAIEEKEYEREYSEGKSKAPKKRKPATPSPLPVQAITPYVDRTRAMLAGMLDDIKAHQIALESLSEEKTAELVQEAQKAELKEPDTKLNKLMHAYINLEHWAKFPSWSVDEFVALSFGLDPKCVTHKSIQPYDGKHDFATQYIQQYELVHRSFSNKEENMFSPLMFIRWAQRLDYYVPNALKVAVKKYQNNYPDPANPQPLLFGGLQNRLDAQTYTWLCEEDPKRYERKFREVARYIIRNNKSETRSEDAIKSSITRGLGEKTLK